MEERKRTDSWLLLQLVVDVAAAGLVVAFLGVIALRFTLLDALIFIIASILFGFALAAFKYLYARIRQRR